MFVAPQIFCGSYGEEMRRTNSSMNSRSLQKRCYYSRYTMNNLRIRSNIHKIREFGYCWRVCRVYRGYWYKFYYSGLSSKSYYSYEEERKRQKLSRCTGNSLYGPYHQRSDERPALWYTRLAHEKDQIRSMSKQDMHRRNKYFYIMGGWHYIDDELLGLAGYEGRIYENWCVDIAVRYIDEDGEKRRFTQRDQLIQLRGLPGVWLPTPLLIRPVNKETEGYKRALSVAKGKRLEKKVINVFNAEEDVTSEGCKESPMINIFGDE